MNLKINSILRLLLLSFALFCVIVSSAQLPGLDKITQLPLGNDSLSGNSEIRFENVNSEIEFTDNLIIKYSMTDFSNKKQSEQIRKIDSLDVYIHRQGKDFKDFVPNKMWRFYLINARVNWKEFSDQLRNLQKILQKDIRDLQEHQNHYISNSEKWKKNLPKLSDKLTPQIENHIQSNLTELNSITRQFDNRIKGLINAENKVIQDIIFAEGILNEINDLLLQRREGLFKKNEKSIFTTNYQGSFSGSIGDRFKLALHENTKTFGYFFLATRNNFIRYTVLFALMILYFLFIRKKYLGLNHNVDYEGSILIKRIFIAKPIMTISTVVIMLWTILTPYSPFIISLFLLFAALVLLQFIISPVVDTLIKRVTRSVIILLAITNLEVFVWYFGNYYRFYLLFESIAGILLTYRFVVAPYNYRNFSDLKKPLLLLTQIIAVSIFALNIISLVANVAGFANLAGYATKLGVYTGVFSLLALGFQRIGLAVIRTSVLVLEIYFPNIVNLYGQFILTRSKLLLNILVGYAWVSAVLHIAEFWESVSSTITEIFTGKIVIGSLSFTFGKIVFFLGVLYFTYVIATFIKRIIEREVLSKYKMKRGLAASISLTIRIFLVFFGTLIALSLSGIDMGKIGIIAGALSVGIGFGLQNIVSNFISGLILIYEKPVMEGDTVEVENLLGRVTNIGIRSSTLVTYDGAEVVVPNSNLISNQLINWTLSDNKKRVEIKVGTAYGTDPKLVLALLMNAALSNQRVLKDPEPVPLFLGFGESSLNFRLLFWVKFEDGIFSQSEVGIKIYELFKENNITIPFPQLDLHVKEK